MYSGKLNITNDIEVIVKLINYTYLGTSMAIDKKCSKYSTKYSLQCNTLSTLIFAVMSNNVIK